MSTPPSGGTSRAMDTTDSEAQWQSGSGLTVPSLSRVPANGRPLPMALPIHVAANRTSGVVLS